MGTITLLLDTHIFYGGCLMITVCLQEYEKRWKTLKILFW